MSDYWKKVGNFHSDPLFLMMDDKNNDLIMGIDDDYDNRTLTIDNHEIDEYEEVRTSTLKKKKHVDSRALSLRKKMIDNRVDETPKK